MALQALQQTTAKSINSVTQLSWLSIGSRYNVGDLLSVIVPALASILIPFTIGVSATWADCSVPAKNKLKLPDIVCDEELRIVVTGDSFVRGVGDQLNGNEGGYVLRLQERFPKATIENLGVPGITTERLYSGFVKNLTKASPGETRFKVDRTDLLVIDVGRNDYFLDVSPAITVRNIYRLVRYLKKELKKLNPAPPYIVVSTLLPTLRPFQRPFIDEVNRLLIRRSSAAFPVLIRYDQIYVGEIPGLTPTPTPTPSATPSLGIGSNGKLLLTDISVAHISTQLLKTTPLPEPTLLPEPTQTHHPILINPILSPDGLHPNSLGYDVMTSKLIKALQVAIRPPLIKYAKQLGKLPEINVTVTPTPTAGPPDSTPDPMPTDSF